MSGSNNAREHHPHPNKVSLNRHQLAALPARIRSEGYSVIGPTVRSGAIDYAVIDRFDDLPTGWTEEQGPGVSRNGSPAFRAARHSPHLHTGLGPRLRGPRAVRLPHQQRPASRAA